MRAEPCFQLGKPVGQLADVKLRQLPDVLLVDPDVERFFFAPQALAFGTGAGLGKILHPGADGVRLGFHLLAQEIDDAFELDGEMLPFGFHLQLLGCPVH